jgi:hypothetical protein
MAIGVEFPFMDGIDFLVEPGNLSWVAAPQ